ncbi:MAG: uroporphyrinogen-III C-methyltransferase [Actinomycetota bacterium]
MNAAPYVVAWTLAGRKVVVVGAGAIGTAKIELLLDTQARLLVIDPTPSDRVRELATQGRLTLRARRARPHDLAGAELLVAATGSTATNRRLRRWAKALRVTVNAVDDRANCDVTVPAIIRRGPATIAVTTNGATPAGARFLREELTAVVDEALPPETGAVFEAAAHARAELRHTGRYRYDYARWRHGFFAPAVSALRAPAPPRHRRQLIDQVHRRFVAEFEHHRTDAELGRITLVGAGPGGVDLITVAGARALAAADVVVYDRLADPELLSLAPPAAERIPVGKGKGYGTTQGAINATLVERALAGAHVVRLKGGDPFVFGRGQEEVDAATAAGLAVTVIPGVSSAVAAPGLAGIPLTDRRLASSFTVLTGHKATSEHHAAEIDAAAAGGGTVVVLMAATTAADVAARLVQAGRSAVEPAAFVHAAATSSERVHHTDLADVAANGCPFPAPTVMVVGPVAAPSSIRGERGPAQVPAPAREQAQPIGR